MPENSFSRYSCLSPKTNWFISQVEVMNVADKSQKTETAFKLFDREGLNNISSAT